MPAGSQAIIVDATVRAVNAYFTGALTGPPTGAGAITLPIQGSYCSEDGPEEWNVYPEGIGGEGGICTPVKVTGSKVTLRCEIEGEAPSTMTVVLKENLAAGTLTYTVPGEASIVLQKCEDLHRQD